MVDIKKNFYFWVTKLSRDFADIGQVLHGISFDDEDFQRSREQFVSSRLCTISLIGTSDLEGDLGFVHVSRSGWVLCLTNGSIASVPCLVTTDTSLRRGFCGPVRVEVAEGSFDVKENVDGGMPVVGDDWLGILTYEASGLFLTSFSQSNWPSGFVRKAYCPWWSDDLDSKDGVKLLISPSGVMVQCLGPTDLDNP